MVWIARVFLSVYRKERADTALTLAARRNGCVNAGVRADTRRDDGHAGVQVTRTQFIFQRSGDYAGRVLAYRRIDRAGGAIRSNTPRLFLLT